MAGILVAFFAFFGIKGNVDIIYGIDSGSVRVGIILVEPYSLVANNLQFIGCPGFLIKRENVLPPKNYITIETNYVSK